MMCKINTRELVIADNKVSSSRNGWTEYDVDVEQFFDVFAMGVYKGRLRLLLDLSDNSRPFWYDVSDFIITSSDISDEWKSASFDEGDWTLLLGYDALITSDSHFNGLLEREDRDMLIFCKIKESYKALRSA